MKIAELEALVELKGQGDRYEALRDQNSDDTCRDLKGTQAKIYSFVVKAGQEVGRGDIAKALKLRKTGWLHAHIEQLVERGYLCRANGQHKNGVLKYLYKVPIRNGNTTD